MPLIQASMVRSGVVDYKAPFILEARLLAQFSAAADALQRYSAWPSDAAKESRVRLPGLEAVEEVYDVAAEEGQRRVWTTRPRLLCWKNGPA